MTRALRSGQRCTADALVMLGENFMTLQYYFAGSACDEKWTVHASQPGLSSFNSSKRQNMPCSVVRKPFIPTPHNAKDKCQTALK